VRLLVLQHIACEHPGAFSDVLAQRGAQAVTAELDEGDALPDLAGFDGVLAMGGPMGAADEAEHPWLAGEKALLRDAVAATIPVLGVCLGAQLVAAALGARTYPVPAGPEVGLLPVQRTAAGRADPVLGALDEPLVTVQWHGDTFDLPGGAELLASSPHCRHQAFRAGSAHALQFHLEVTAEQVDAWSEVPAYRSSLADVLGASDGAAFLAEARRRAPELGAAARRVMEAWLTLVEDAAAARQSYV
jgi:GMP synthase (glutamine-hydrolysing)